MTGTSPYERILKLLDAEGCSFREVEHPPVRTAEEAAEVRGTPLAMGAKAIVFKLDGTFRVLALSAARALRSRALRRELGVRRTRFATAAELAELTGLEPGMVPPFGHPVLPLDLLADPSLLDPPEIAFTPGRNDRSIFLASADWRRLARPRVVPFSRPRPEP